MDPVARDILRVAIAEFSEHGLAGARVDAISARTRTSKRMLYYHFGSKEGLYAAALAHAYDQVRSERPLPAVDALAPMLALRAYVGHVFDVHVSHPEFVRLVMGENLLRGRFVLNAPPIRQVNLLGLEVLEHIIERGQAEATMRADLRVLDVYANIVGLAFHFVSNRSTFSAIFEQGQDPVATQDARRRSIVDTIERQVMAWPLERAAVAQERSDAQPAAAPR